MQRQPSAQRQASARTQNPLNAISRLPATLSPNFFFERAEQLASRAGSAVIARAAQRAFSAFKSLPDDYFHGKGVETYTFHATFPHYTELPQATAADAAAIFHSLAQSTAVSVYHHVPFCASKCSYCSFASKARGRNARAEYSDYFDTVWRERRLWNDAIRLAEKAVTSIYFGGGTPTVLPVRVLREVLKQGKDVNLAQGGEVTCEASPGTLSKEKARLLGREATRVSIGVQSFDDELLRFMNRDHDAARAEAAIRLAMAHSPHVNVDLIYGFPTQSLEQWISTLERIIEISPQSITIYRYWRKRGSVWFKEEFDFTHELAARLMYFTAIETLERAGYSLGPLHWLLKGIQNKEYSSRWGEGIPNVGFGVAGYGSSRNFVFRKTANAQEYAEAVARGEIPFKNALVFNDAMRQASGLAGSLRAFHKASTATITNETINETIARWIAHGLAELREETLYLTDSGKALFEWMEDELLTRLNKT